MSTSTILIIFLVLIVLLSFVIIGLLVAEYLKKNNQLKRYQGISDLEAEQNKVKAKTDKLRKSNELLKKTQDELNKSIAELNTQLGSLDDELNIQAHGLYEPKYDFDSSERYKKEIDRIRQQQKQMIKDKKAVEWATEWTVHGSSAQGRKMMNEQTKLTLRAFNGECDSLILKVKYNNVDRIEKRINSVYEAINKLGKTNNSWINPEYYNLKLKELYLVHEYQEKKQEELEEQRRIREEMREEERAQRELEKARLEAEKEETRYQKALGQARKEIEKASGKKQAKLQADIERLNQLLQEAQEKRERAKSRAEMTRSGYVYVISNIGSFGEDIYKIGMTRRLYPEDRVKELGDASVPFPFDIHAMIFSDDAPGLENTLHKEFQHKRVNRVNERKEFFNVSLKEIEKAVIKKHGEIEFTLLAKAEDYRKTQAIKAEEKTYTPDLPSELVTA